MLVPPTAQQHSYDTRAQLDTEVRNAFGHSTLSALCLHPETGPCSARLSLPHAQKVLTCPLCVEELDETDRDFFPCPCGCVACMAGVGEGLARP